MTGDEDPGDLQLLLIATFRLMTSRVKERLEGEGQLPLRITHGYTLRFILENPDRGLPEVAGHLGVSRQAAWKIVGQLEGWGLVERRWNPDDRRFQQIRITDAGHVYIKRAMELLAEEYSSWSQTLGPGRLRRLRDDLQVYVGDRSLVGDLGLSLW